MILVFKYIFPSRYCGMAIYPFIFLKEEGLKIDEKLINHERIHLKQQLELLWILFFIWYFFEYLFRLYQFKNHYKAYKNISFEKEAYKNENNLTYLRNRKLFSFTNYLK